MSAYDYAEPHSLEEVIDQLERHGEDAHLIAGGTSLILMLRQQLLSPRVLVGLRGIPSLRGIHVDGDGSLEIGATTTHRTIEHAPEVTSFEPALAAAFGHVATVRIRNQGTIGGNLAHADPAQDPPPMLLALDAAARVAGSRGAREIPLENLFIDFFETSLEETEVITSVIIPPRPAGASAAYVKFLPGSKDDYATVAVAVSAVTTDGRWSDVRLACGAVAAVPLRIRAAEEALEGSVIDDAGIERAADLVAEGVDPIDDLRGSADYKREMAMVWVRRTLRRIAGQGEA